MMLFAYLSEGAKRPCSMTIWFTPPMSILFVSPPIRFHLTGSIHINPVAYIRLHTDFIDLSP